MTSAVAFGCISVQTVANGSGGLSWVSNSLDLKDIVHPLLELLLLIACQDHGLQSCVSLHLAGVEANGAAASDEAVHNAGISSALPRGHRLRMPPRQQHRAPQEGFPFCPILQPDRAKSVPMCGPRSLVTEFARIRCSAECSRREELSSLDDALRYARFQRLDFQGLCLSCAADSSEAARVLNQARSRQEVGQRVHRVADQQ